MHPYLWIMEFWEKNLEYNNFLEFNICSTFYSVVLTKNNNLYILHNVLKHQSYTVFRTNAQACSHKNATSLWQKWTHIRRNKIINTYQWISLCNCIKHISLDNRYNLLLVIPYWIWRSMWQEENLII